MSINENYTNFYKNHPDDFVYPTEFIVRILLAKYPNLNYPKPQKGDKILDIGCGDGRNTRFLCEQGYDVYGTEITKEIIEHTSNRLTNLGLKADLRVGRNNSLAFDDSFFDYLLAAAVIYYVDQGNSLNDNLIEYSRVLKKGAYLIASVANLNSYIFKNSEKSDDGSRIIKNDPYKNRINYKLHGFESTQEIESYFSPYFSDFSFGSARNNYFGIDESLFYIVCKKK